MKIDVLQRGVKVIELLSRSDTPPTLQGIADQLGTTKSSVYRILLTWESLGYAERQPGSGRFRLGIRALELARNIANRNALVEQGHSALMRLHRQFREGVYLGLYRNQQLLLVDAIESVHPLRVVMDLGETCYLHASAVGRAVAAFLDGETLSAILERDNWPKLTPHTNTDPRKLAAILAGVRINGYALNCEETLEGCICLGAPLFAGDGGAVVAALGVSIPAVRASQETLRAAAQGLVREAAELSRKLAGLQPEAGALPRTDRNGPVAESQTQITTMHLS